MSGYGAGIASVADRVAKHRKATRLIARRSCENPARRRRYEKDPAKWLRYYCGRTMFPYPFSAGHLAIITETISAARTGTGAAVAAPRGEGKTTVLRGVAVYLLALGLVRFPVLVGWKHRDAKAALKLWLRMLTESREFRADYPEFTQPFEHSVHATALRNLAWEDSGALTGAMVDNADQLLTLPDSRGAVAARSAQGDAKGLNAIMPDGTVLRPDFVILDDAQDPDRADNPSAVQDTVDVLENVFLGMAGPQHRLTAAAACTVEAEGDVSDHWLSRPGWKSVRISRIEEWPGGGHGGDWPDPSKPVVAMWEEWNRIRLSDGEKAAVAYYRAHKQELTAGMRVSWTERYDRERGDPDACYAAMWDRYNQGADVFARGQQNKPLRHGVTLYNLTPAVIESRTTDREPGVVPADVTQIVAGIDVNPSYGLTWAACGFGLQLGYVIDYGRTPLSVTKEMPEQEQARLTYEGLASLLRGLSGKPYRLNMVLFDVRGWNYESAYNLSAVATKMVGIITIGAMGFGARNYRPNYKAAGRKGNNWHIVTDDKRRQYVSYCSDFWKEVSQKAWLGSVGSPGSCSLPKGHHREFAEQICREPLLAKSDTRMGVRWEYGNLPGQHDMGDAMQMCFLAADMCGVGTGGQPVVRKRYVETRKPRVMME